MNAPEDLKIERRKKRTPRKVTAKYLDNAALYYLSRFATSAENLRRVMMRKIQLSAKHHGTSIDDGADLLDSMIQRYLNFGLLDDPAYAKTRAASLHRRGNSARVITGKLKQNGVGSDDIAAAIDALRDDLDDGEDPEFTAALTLARKRRFGPFGLEKPGEEKRTKQLAALARAGFSYGIAKRIINADDEEDLEHPC